MTSPRIAVGPQPAPFATDAVESGGGSIVGIDDRPDAVVWLDPQDVKGLADHMGQMFGEAGEGREEQGEAGKAGK